MNVSFLVSTSQAGDLSFSEEKRKKLKLNIHFTVPDEFQYDPVSKSYGDVTRRPEVKSSTIEFIAPSEYMVSGWIRKSMELGLWDCNGFDV